MYIQEVIESFGRARASGCVLVFLMFFSSSVYGTEVSLHPDTVYSSNVRDTIMFDIVVSDVDSPFSFSCDLSCDPYLLEITEIIEGDLLCWSGGDSVSTSLTYDIG
jgi:hypothetical protein